MTGVRIPACPFVAQYPDLQQWLLLHRCELLRYVTLERAGAADAQGRRRGKPTAVTAYYRRGDGGVWVATVTDGRGWWLHMPYSGSVDGQLAS